MAKKKNEWLYRALCAALAVTLVSGMAVMSPVADIVGITTSITANAAYEGYTTWTGTGTDENGNSATVTCYWKIDNGKLYIAGNIPNKGSGTIPWYAYRKSITEVYAEKDTITSEDASSLFYGLSAATKMDLSNLDTSNATKMTSMFSGCSSLKSLDLSGWDTSNVTNMSSMFRDCTALESLNLSGWNTSSVIYMGNMFCECKALTALDLSSFNTEKVTYMYQMFYMCNALTTLNLSSFDTSKVDNMQEMFYMCNALTTLDLSSFDTSSVTTMYGMLGMCSNLETIYVSDGWNTDNVTNSNFMFRSSSKIKGGNGTTYDSSKLDKTYACIDGKDGQPGYFTQGPAPAKTYTITWKNYDGTTLETDENVEEGTTPEYNGTTPTKEGNARYTYTFSGWDNELTAVTGDVTYTAQFTETDRYAGYTTWTGTGTDENGNSATVTCYWKIDNGKLYIAGNIPNLSDYRDAPWYNNSRVTSVYVEEGARTSASPRYLFRDLYNATSIDVSNLDTSNAVNMYSMFSGCKALTSLDLSSWDISKVTDLEWFLEECNNLESLNLDGWDISSVTTTGGMFAKCKKLTSLDLSGWDTSKVRNMSSMFQSCSSLTSLDLSGWNTSEIWTTDYMFSYCTSLTSLDLSAFDTSKVTGMYMTFSNCTNLETVYVGDGWNTDNVTNSNFMFRNCTNIVGGNGTTYDSNYIDKTYARIDGGPESDTPGYFTINPIIAQGDYWKVTDEDGDGSYKLVLFSTIPNTYGNNDSSKIPWYTYRKNITEVYAEEGAKTSAEASRLFADLQNATSMDLSNLDTSDATQMFRMFANCKALTTLDLRGWDTSNVTDMERMFNECRNLTSLNLSGWNTSSVTDMDSIFYYCDSLTSLDMSGWDTKNVTDMCNMFGCCKALTSLDVSGWNTSSVTTMREMFYHCESLTPLDVSSWDTKNVKNMLMMFAYCKAFTSLDLSSWDTGNVTSTSCMFYGCQNLATLDLSGWNTSKVSNMSYMFNECGNLVTVYVGSKWNTDNVTSNNSTSMFADCSTKLVGGNGTAWNSSNPKDKTYARIDGGESNPGYFTAKAAPTYTVTWLNDDGTELGTTSAETGTSPVYSGATPTKEGNAQYSYTFKGWTSDGGTTVYTTETLPTGTEDVTYTAVFESTVNTYTVTWKNDDGTILETDTDVAYGTEPTYDGAAPTKEGNAQYTYTFSGWTPEITAVTGDTTYTAQFTETTNTYTVTWQNEDGTVLETDTVAYGETPTYDGATPEKTATAQYTYTFSGWTPEISAVAEDVTYTAQFTESVNEYTVTWVDGDGNTLATDTVAYGSTPEYNGTTPTKEGTAQYSYTFSGWTPEISAVTGDVTYTAQFTETTNTYTVTWVDGDGNTTTDTVEYGTVPTAPANPTKTNTSQYTYTFSGWDKEITAVTGNVTYTAQFTETTNTYTVTWLNEDGSVIDTTTVAYGETPTHADATKASTAQYTYTFNGWSPAVTSVTGNATYTAQFTETTNTYTVTWQNEDGTVLETDTDVAYGTTPSYDGAAPTKESTTEYRYIFSGWTPSVDTVTGDVVYTATFTQERHFIDDTHHAWYTFDKETGHMEIYGDGQAFKKQYAFGTFTSSKPNTQVTSVHLNNDNGEINTKDFTGWFQSFTALKSVTGKFPAVVERMGSTFYNCKSLTYVEFVPEVTVAATKMFSSCTKLSSIGNADNTIKISCTSYQGVFQGCYVLNANVVFNKSLNAVNIERGYYENAFENAAVWGGNIVVCMTSNVNDETVELIKSTVVNNTSSKKQNISYHHYSDYIDNGDGTHSHTCDVCGESETENHTFDNGICTVCGSKEDYTITVTNGIVAKGEKEIYHVGDIVTLKADEPEEGKVFAYWADGSGNKLSTKANYSFVVLQSVDLTAVYDTEYTAQAILNISAVQTSSNGKNAIRFVFNRSVDTKAQVEEVGLIYATNKLAGYTDGAKVNLAESDFDIETALKDNTNGKVKTYKGTSTSINGTIRLTYTIGNNTDCYVYAYGYVKLTDGTTLYTDLLATTYDSIV